MKRFVIILTAIAIAVPMSALAQKKVDEYGEEVLNPDVIEQVAPSNGTPKKSTKESAIQEITIGAEAPKSGSGPDSKNGTKASTPAPSPPVSPTHTYGISTSGRQKRFRAGFVGPGFGYYSRGYGPAVTFGFDGEYFFFERLSAGLRFEMATKFKSPTLISIVPQARYIFDFDRHPRFAAYAQAGVGVGIAAGGGSYAAADIALPGGGFWWQWTDKWSVGAETNFHILVRSVVAVGWTISPAMRYIF